MCLVMISTSAMPMRLPATRAVFPTGGTVSANSAGSEKAAAENAEPSRNLRRSMSRPESATTVPTVPRSVPALCSPSYGSSGPGPRSVNPHSVTPISRCRYRDSAPATSRGTGHRGWDPSSIRLTAVVFVPRWTPSSAPALTTARASAALLMPASSSSARNAALSCSGSPSQLIPSIFRPRSLPVKRRCEAGPSATPGRHPGAVSPLRDCHRASRRGRLGVTSRGRIVDQEARHRSWTFPISRYTWPRTPPCG